MPQERFSRRGRRHQTEHIDGAAPAAALYAPMAALIVCFVGAGLALPEGTNQYGRYVAFWNSPWPTGCTSPPESLPDWKRWRIQINDNASFLGEKIATIYTAGRFPMYKGIGPGGACADGDWNCTNATAVYGGLPQLANLTHHLAVLQQDIEKDIPDPDASGVYNIDWEAWKPAFDANRYNEYWIYVNRSEALVKARHPGLSPAQVTLQAEREFNEASRAFWTESLRLCKKLRPKAQWGWYNYPVDAWPATFSELSWLYDEVTALFPSIYLFKHNATENAAYVDKVLNQTRQVRDAARRRTGRLLPIYSFAWLDYDLPAPLGYLSAADLHTEVARGATKWGLTGVILWGASADGHNTSRCQAGPASFTSFVDNIAGPVVLAAAQDADACAAKRCSGHGRCWQGDSQAAGGACDCDEGWSGASCATSATAVADE